MTLNFLHSFMLLLTNFLREVFNYRLFGIFFLSDLLEYIIHHRSTNNNYSVFSKIY